MHSASSWVQCSVATWQMPCSLNYCRCAIVIFVCLRGTKKRACKASGSHLWQKDILRSELKWGFPSNDMLVRLLFSSFSWGSEHSPHPGARCQSPATATNHCGGCRERGGWVDSIEPESGWSSTHTLSKIHQPVDSLVSCKPIIYTMSQCLITTPIPKLFILEWLGDVNTI